MYDKLKLANRQTIRIATVPWQYICHLEYTDSNSLPVLCAIDNCPLCQCGKRPNRGWFLIALNKEDNKLYRLNLNANLFSKLRELFMRNGDPQNYDVDLIYDGTVITPLIRANSDLTEEQTKLIKSIDTEKLRDACDPKNHNRTLLEKLALLS